jgi:predicted nucleotidyltransferase
MEIQYYLDKIVTVFKEEMKDNLIGIYLHGSLAMGCFNPTKSDIDFLVVAEKELTIEVKKSIAKKLLALHEELPNDGGLEMSILLERHLKQFVYPTPFELHYSSLHKEKYSKDENYICGGLEDPDLAAHIVVTYHRGFVLYGKPIREVFQPIPKQYYVQSILSDVQNAKEAIVESPVYYTLNLCRVLYFLKDGIVSSKKEGGEWAATSLPSKYKNLVNECLNQYYGLSDYTKLSNDELIEFATYMLDKINEQLKKEAYLF